MDCQIYLEAEKQEQDICLQPEAYNQASGGTIKITENGTYDVTKYQEAEVAVDAPTETIKITANGQYDVTNYAKADVSVPLPDDLFNTTLSSNRSAPTDLLLQEFVNWDSPNLPETWSFNLDLFGAQELFGDWGFKKLVLTGQATGTSAYSMFSGCKNLTSVDLTNFNMPNLTDVANLVYQCANLQSIDLSNIDTSKVTDMNYVFGYCDDLEYVNISGWLSNESVSNSYLFYQCFALKAVVIDSPAVFKLSNPNAITGSSIARGTGFVYVPDDLVDEYKSATNWTTVADQIKPLSELPQEVKDVFHMA